MIWRLSQPAPSGTLIARIFLELIDVKVSFRTLQSEIEEHPDYPSLLSISDVFTKFHVDNITANFTPENIRNVPAPFITQLKGKSIDITYFTVIRAVKGQFAEFFDPEKRKWSILSLDELQERSAGVVLLAEGNENSGEKDYAVKSRAEKISKYGLIAIPFIVTFLYLSLLLSYFLKTQWAAIPFAFFSVLSFIGVGSGVLLTWYEIDHYNPVIQQICKAGKNINCNAILQSDAARIGGISWSAIGLSYFIGTFTLLLYFILVGSNIMSIVSWMSLFAVPYIFYSIYYQWKVAKQWCMLCLLVQGVLLFQAIVVIASSWLSDYSVTNLTSVDIIVTIVSYLLPFFFFISGVPVIKKAKEGKSIRRDFNRLKYDPIIFNALLKKQRPVVGDTSGLGIRLGDPNAKIRILKVCNPYCGPCGRAHIHMEDLLKNNPDVQIQIIFTASTDETDYKRLPVRHFLSISNNNNEGKLRSALDDWYLVDDKSYENFTKMNPPQDDFSIYDNQVAEMKKWCDENEILHTPTIFVNNHELPESYGASDLQKFFTD